MTYVPTPAPILSVLCGSRLYGTHRPDSDFDVRSVFVTPIEDLIGLTPPSDSFTRKEGDLDVAQWEVGKFVHMALKGSFTALELLYAPEANYMHVTAPGRLLLDNRDLFLTDAVRSGLVGFVQGQIKETQRTGLTKPLSHAIRVLFTLDALHETGTLSFCLPNLREKIGAVLAACDTDQLRGWVESVTVRRSVLPMEPNLAAIKKLLLKVRYLEERLDYTDEPV